MKTQLYRILPFTNPVLLARIPQLSQEHHSNLSLAHIAPLPEKQHVRLLLR